MGVSDIKKQINRVCCAIFIFVGICSALTVAQALSSDFVSSLFDDESGASEIYDNLFMGFTYVISYLVAFLLYKVAYKKNYLPPRLSLSLGNHPIAAMLASLAIVFTASHLAGYFGSGSSSIDEYHGQSIVLLMFTTVLVPAFFEELFFRGLILTNLLPLGRSFAIIASGVIFGLVHGNHDQIFFASISGIIFGWLYVKTGSLWCGIIVHMFNNFIAVAETVFIGSFRYADAMKICMLIELAVLVIGVLAIIYLILKRKEENERPHSWCFGSVSPGLLDGGVHYTVDEYMKGFFSPAMIVFLCYVLINEIVYVVLF